MSPHSLGFDLLPRIKKDDGDDGDDQAKWKGFLLDVRQRYKAEGSSPSLVIEHPGFLELNIGDHPKLPYACWKFKTFASRALDAETVALVKNVYKLIKYFFSDRLLWWDESKGSQCRYQSIQVQSSIDQYREEESDLETERKVTTIAMLSPRHIEGKGIGLIATRDLPSGERIFGESPLFTIPYPQLPAAHLVRAQVDALNNEDKRKFFNLNKDYNYLPTSYAIFNSNAFILAPDDKTPATEKGLFIAASRLNHSCSPNAHAHWNETINQLTLHATTEIPKDTEVTISYTTPLDYANLVKTALKPNCVCVCATCQNPNPDREANLRELQRLDMRFQTSVFNGMHPLDYLASIRARLVILTKEKIAVITQAVAYEEAMEVAFAHSDQARGSVFAGFALDIREMCEGKDDMREEIEGLRTLKYDPEMWEGFGGEGEMWKQRLLRVPKVRVIGREAFQRWLWRDEDREIREEEIREEENMEEENREENQERKEE